MGAPGSVVLVLYGIVSEPLHLTRLAPGLGVLADVLGAVGLASSLGVQELLLRLG